MRLDRPRPAERVGWPLHFIPAGRENWLHFLYVATDEQVEQALIAVSKALAVRDGRDPEETQ